VSSLYQAQSMTLENFRFIDANLVCSVSALVLFSVVDKLADPKAWLDDALNAPLAKIDETKLKSTRIE
jgi:hypothetical protein